MLKRTSNNGIFILTKKTIDTWHWRIKHKGYIFCLYIVNAVIKRCEGKKDRETRQMKKII